MHVPFIRAAATLLPYLVTNCEKNSTGDNVCNSLILGKTALSAPAYDSFVDGQEFGACTFQNSSDNCGDGQALRANVEQGSDSTWTIYDETSSFPLALSTDTAHRPGTTYTVLVATSTETITPFYASTAALATPAASVTPTAAPTGGSGGGKSESGNGNGSPAGVSFSMDIVAAWMALAVVVVAAPLAF